MALDVDAYFKRIGYDGPRDASLATLAAIHRRHPEAIPFENLNPFLGLPVRLDIASLEEKLLRSGRGGYCFEHNLLLSHVLAALGFTVKGLGARVLWNADDTVRPRTHMLLLVDIDGHPHIADVGFGGLVMTAPLRLEADVEQSTPHEPFRLTADGDSYILQAKIRDRWTSLYRFDLHEQLLPDYEMANFYVACHPESRFVNGILAARVDADRRYGLFNNEFSVHHTGAGTEKRKVGSSEELRSILEDAFRITLPETPELDGALRRLIENAA